MDISHFLYDDVGLNKESHRVFYVTEPNESESSIKERIESSQSWLNFNNISCFLYPKGAHSILRNLVELSGYEYTESNVPHHNKQVIPVVEPLYAFFGGYFSGTGLDDTVRSQDELLKWFDDITGEIILGNIRLEPHLISLPNRLLLAYNDYEFGINKVEVLDTGRHGISYFIRDNFEHLDNDLKLRLYESALTRSLTSPYSMIISNTFYKWQRDNRFKNHHPALIDIFANEYKLYDYFRLKSATDHENRKGG